MNFSKAKQEFDIRYYLWATSEFETEISESFPSFHSFKAGSVWELHQLMRLLSRSEQLTLARGLLKRFHSDAVTVLGETCSPEEESLRSKWDAFANVSRLYKLLQHLDSQQLQLDEAAFNLVRPDVIRFFGENCPDKVESLLPRLDAVFRAIPLSREEEIRARKRAGEKIKSQSKRMLRKAITTKFKDVFGSQCLGPERVSDPDPTVVFEMKSCGWILSTHFWFGRHESLINYSHSIASETRIQHPKTPEIAAPAMLLHSRVSFGAWLGITAQIQWEYLMDEDVEPACDAAIKLCGHFFDVAPKLLKGIEGGTVTPD